MKGKIFAAVSTGALLAVANVPLALANPGNGRNCVGGEVSSVAHDTRQEFDQGFGEFLQSLGLNPGQLIQAFDAASCDG
jgi:hypothetical protein